jgi:hypothetical protein
MIKKSSQRKLTIARDTIRALSKSSLGTINGGFIPPPASNDKCIKVTVVKCCLDSATDTKGDSTPWGTC